MSEKNSDQNPAPWATMTTPELQSTPWWREPKTIIPLGLLVVILVLVVFWLPNQIAPHSPITNATSSSSNAADSNAETVSSNTTPAKPSAPLESPWTDAQIAKQRREAQDILARLLDQQRLLEQSAVSQWAQQEFEQAIQTAANGDEFYQNRQFAEAKAQYLTAEEQLKKLTNKREQVFAKNLSGGEQALINFDAESAQAQLALAASIEPNNKQAKQLLERANNLSRVLSLIKLSDQAITQGDLDQAQQYLQQAKKLGPKEQPVTNQQTKLNKILLDKNFAEAMSNGYLALQQQDFESAIQYFNQALKYKPNAVDADAALTQAKNSKIQAAITQHLNTAKKAIEQEEWQKALQAYDRALAIDKNLVTAKIERIKANVRWQLDQDLSQFIASPIKLSDDQVYLAAKQRLADANSIAKPGPKLSQQVTELSQLLAVAQKPIQVTLESDNLTHVTLYRVGQLGNFDQRFIDLKPGQYTIVGSRSGYRDVRKEFTVQPNSNGHKITISCQEKINQG